MTAAGAVFAWGKWANGRIGLGQPKVPKRDRFGRRMRRKVIPRFQFTPTRLRFGSAGEGNEDSFNVFRAAAGRVRIEMVAGGFRRHALFWH